MIAGSIRVAYNGQKRKHTLKYQALKASDGLILYLSDSIEGSRNDWTLSAHSGLEAQLSTKFFVDGKQYYLHGDSGYNRCSFLEISFQGSNITEDQRHVNKAISQCRITLE